MSVHRIRDQASPIAFASYTKENDVGGVKSWMEDLLLRLHADGVPVVLLLLHYGSEIPRQGYWERLIDAGITVEVEPVPLEDEINNPRFFVRKILNFLDRHAPRLFLPNCRNTLYFAARIAGLQGLPWVFTVHSDDPLFWSVAKAVRPKTSKGHYVAVSEHVAQRLKEQCLDVAPSVIPYGVSLSPERASPVVSSLKVVYSGRIVEEQKRISLVLQAMATACRYDSRIECWLFGDGPDLEKSFAWVEAQKLSDRIHFLGRLDVAEVRKRVRDHHVILLLSDYEGLGISLLEAMTCGVVPVVRCMPPLTEFVIDEKTGLLVEPDPEQAAKAIIRLLDDPDLWSRCSVGAQQIVANEYSHDRSCRRWLELITELSNHSTIAYPVSRPVFLQIPLRYEPSILQLNKLAVRYKWMLIQLWYQRILPLFSFVRSLLR